MPIPHAPGLLILHGNRLELLAEAVMRWLAAHPLGPLEEETVLVPSNGMAEWFKMEWASAQGICAAMRVELPARFIWRAYRAVLGPAAVPVQPALDKLPLTWRLMQLLPALASEPGFEPVRSFLAAAAGAAPPAAEADPTPDIRRLQLAQRLADLFDQYQVHRSDWLQDWEQGLDRLRREAGSPAASVPVPPDQRWQPALWRAARASLGADAQQATRAELHQRFLHALAGAPAHPTRPWPHLPRRVLLFGTTHIPHQTLEALAALAAHTQVLMAVPNPCRHHWADIIDGRQLLRAATRRHAHKGPDLAAVPLQDMHAHGHPLLAAWGRQSRDFVRQLDAFDDVQQARERFQIPRVDLFDEGPGQTLLGRVQAHIRELEPLPEQPCPPPPAEDRSIVFHIAHSAQREVEILHDQLLHLLAHPPGGQPLHPRDIVVMVPEIDRFAPAIRAVFGQIPRGHARHIPWGIADQRGRGQQPLLVALEWLLRAPQQRFAASELRDWLDVPAAARRLGLREADGPTVAEWLAGAGVRWGLHARHREQLGLQACGDTGTAHFGLQRMLLGYATGELDAGHDGIEPYAEVAGLSAGLAGALAELLDRLQAWWADCQRPRPPTAWAQRLRGLLGQMFEASDDGERALLAALDDALGSWLQACEGAGFEQPLPLAVVREAWLGALDEPGAGSRFKAGGVTFCTLLPMRAIPFEVVCLLGMNDGDYPRRSTRSDFDLMAGPGLARPGDRSRRDDDRQLMLDALLSARRVLYLSWTGRSARDNQAQPPSVLVSQLRDHLCAGWGLAVVQARTTEHPLQPFSRRYFQAAPGSPEGATPGSQAAHADAGPGAPGLFTYAAEWRAAHQPLAEATAARPAAAAATARTAPAADPGGGAAEPPVTLQHLARFARNPVQDYFRQRLQIRFDDLPRAADDDEPFATAGLDRWQLLDEALRALRRRLPDPAAAASPDAPALVNAAVARLQRAGRLPLAGPGRRVQETLVATLTPMVAHWLHLRAQHPLSLDKRRLQVSAPDGQGLRLDDWLTGLHAAASGPHHPLPDADTTPVWIELHPSKLVSQPDTPQASPRADKLLHAWVRSLAAAACGQPVAGVLIGANAVLHIAPCEPQPARQDLLALLRARHQGLHGARPWPTAVLTGLALLDSRDQAARVFEGSRFGGADGSGLRGEGDEACLARLYPDFAALAAEPDFEPCSSALYAPYRHWLRNQVHPAPLPDHAELPEADGD